MDSAPYPLIPLTQTWDVHPLPRIRYPIRSPPPHLSLDLRDQLPRPPDHLRRPLPIGLEIAQRGAGILERVRQAASAGKSDGNVKASIAGIV